MYIYNAGYRDSKMSNKTSSTAIYAMILTIGALFIPLQFSFANTNTSTYHLQGVIGHTCDQTMSTIHMGGCSTGASYRAVQNTVPPDTNSSSGDTSGAYPATADRRHDAQ
jgi:hypothetical protein